MDGDPSPPRAHHRLFSFRGFGTAHSSPAPSGRSSRSRSGKAGSDAVGCRGCAIVLSVPGDYGSGGRCESPTWPRSDGERPAVPGDSGRALSLITPSCLRRCPGMDGRWPECRCPRDTRGGRDGLGKDICPRGKPAGNIAACHRVLWPAARSGEPREMGVSTHPAQSPLETRVLGLAAPRQGSAAYPVSDTQIQTPRELG